MCGEKHQVGGRHNQRIGSPPRVRGKVDVSERTGSAYGITPACAGKSKNPPFTAIAVEDHPRVCGEKTSTKKRNHKGLGSPPRVRGKDQMRR